jgi:hypothetical protein
MPGIKPGMTISVFNHSRPAHSIDPQMRNCASGMTARVGFVRDAATKASAGNDGLLAA